MRQLAMALVMSAALCGAARSAQADEYDDHVARASELARGDRHREALREWTAAYNARQAPRLLYEMGRSQQSLGLVAEAVSSYERFLAADRGEDPAARADAEAQLARLRLLPGARGAAPLRPQPVGLGEPEDGDVRYVPVRYERRPNRGLLTAGITLLSIGYGAAFVTGTTMTTISGTSSSSSSADRAFTNASGILIIPIVGPIISSIYLPSASRSEAVAYWSLPWMLTSAPLQVAGLIMTVIGAKDVRARPVTPALSERLQIAPYSMPGGGGVVASLRF